MHYEIYLPFPPTINSYYSKTQRGVYISERGRKFRDQVKDCVFQQLPNVNITEEVLVELVFYMPDKRRRDIDNYVKPTLDSLTEAGLWTDDVLVDQLMVYRGGITRNGGSFVRITDAGPILKIGQTPPED